MGGLMSRPDTSAKERSDEIDRQIDEDSQRVRHECKVLILGSSGSGKTTLLKQIMIMHKDGFAPHEFSSFIPTVHRNVFDSAHHLVAYMKKIEMECAEDENRLLAEKIYTHILPTPASDDAHILAPEIVQAIYKVCKDPIIAKIMDEHRSNFYLMDSAPYFFNEVLRIGAPGYIPNEADVLRARGWKMRGIKEMRIRMGRLSMNLVDVGGQRSERKKWIHCFESVASIIYCVGLDQYNQTLLEEKTRNRISESVLLFESVVNSRWFLRTNIMLLMTKVDIFKALLKKDPLDHYFPEYTGGDDINKAAKYILSKFVQTNRARLSIYPHLVQATDPSNLRLVFAAIKEAILQNSSKDSGIL